MGGGISSLDTDRAASAPSVNLNIINNATGSYDDPNLVLQIPHGGGIATGGHTVNVMSDSVSGYTLSLLFQTTYLANSSADESVTIPSTSNKTPNVLQNNTWGYAVAGSGGFDAEGSYNTTNQDTLAKAKFLAIPSAETVIASGNQATSGTDTKVYYGIKVNAILAGNYRTAVMYTATAKIPPRPVLSKATPNYYDVELGGDNEITLLGNFLDHTNQIYIDLNRNGQYDDGEACTDIDIYSVAQVSCHVPTSTDIKSGEYDIYLSNYSDQPAIIKSGFEYIAQSVCRNGDPDSNCQVDIDANMLPITYSGDTSAPRWSVLSLAEVQDSRGVWYDYSKKKWANAVTIDWNDTPRYKVWTGDTSGREIVLITRYDDDGSRYYDREHFSGYMGEISFRDALTALRDGWWNGFEVKNSATFPTVDGLPNTLPTLDNILSDVNVLGYWVYAPRYAYEVMRPNAIDKVVTDTQAKAEGGFKIRFEKVGDAKKTPANTCSTATDHKDYRTECFSNDPGKLHLYYNNSDTDGTVWATHPAFSWGDKELNGIWVGKFETTGTKTNPTVKPNQHANISQTIGEFYTMAKSIGVSDPNNTGGNPISGIAQNSHNLATTSSHMMKNSEWGAVTYLASSRYGVGINEVQINSAHPDISADADGQSSSHGITGCGPSSDGNTSTYTDGTALSSITIESNTACSQNKSRAYYGSIGQLASTTNNTYGIYDMSGGVFEYVMGNRTASDTQTTSTSSYFKNPTTEPYVDLYKVSDGFGAKPSWSSSSSEDLYNNDVCTWGTCGGHALHETKKVQSVSGGSQSWGSDYSYFATSDDQWFARGGDDAIGSGASLFYSGQIKGYDLGYYGFRSVLSAPRNAS